MKDGLSFSKLLSQHSFFPQSMVSLSRIGEESGALSNAFLKLSELYEDEVALHTRSLIAVIEPTLIILLAGVIGTLVIALFLPILQIMEMMVV